jgi:hypothetical protein
VMCITVPCRNPLQHQVQRKKIAVRTGRLDNRGEIMLGGITNDVISGTLAMVITCCPLGVLAMIVWQWQKELHAASRLRHANAWSADRSRLSGKPETGQRFL